MTEKRDCKHPPLDRKALEPCLGDCFHPARSLSQADVFEMTGEASGWVLKDFSARPLWIRLLVTRRFMRREARALAALRDLEGVPRLAGLVGPDAMLIERLEAERLPHRWVAIPSEALFQRLNALVAEMHRRGWAHGDLRRKNILMDRDERPYLIDFATAWHAGPRDGPLRRWLLKHWRQIDRVTLARIKKAYLPDSLTPGERDLLARQPRHLRVGRWLKKKVYRPLKPRHRRETWRRITRFFRP